MFFSIPNLNATDVREMEKPWEYVPATPVPYDLPKVKFQEWSHQNSTRHAFISGVEGTSKLARVNKDNPPARMHCIIVDYDRKMIDNPVEYLRKNCPGPIMPQYICWSQSGKGRAMWDIEAPFNLISSGHHKELIKRAIIDLKLNLWLLGIDTPALENASQYYEIGQNWMKVSDDVVPMSKMFAWDLVASEKIKKDMQNLYHGVQVNIPMEIVAEEVERRYPGRWSGKFEVGARGVRFWDPNADNPTGAMVTPNGCKVYTPHDSGFKPWISIFDENFVSQYAGMSSQAILENVVHDGDKYWVRDPGTGRWDYKKDANFNIWLGDLGFDSRRGKDEKLSEVDRKKHEIMTKNRVSIACEMIYRPPGPIVYMGEPVLNLTNVKPTQPAVADWTVTPTWDEARKHFPFIWQVLTSMFVDKDVHVAAEDPENDYDKEISNLQTIAPPEDPVECSTNDTKRHQLFVFLAWLRRYYKGALSSNPVKGQVMCIAGKVSRGKTWLIQVLMAKLMDSAGRGYADGAAVLMENDQFTGEILRTPLVVLDDPPNSHTYKEQEKTMAKVKRLVANGSLRFNEKYMKSAMAEFVARIVITCNIDPKSLSVLPDTNSSNGDKYILIKLAARVARFYKTQAETYRQTMAELPYFARWLLDWNPPESVTDDGRWGVVSHHHAELTRTIGAQGTQGVICSVIDTALSDDSQTGESGEYWEGTTTLLYELLVKTAPASMRQLGVHAVGGVLAGLASKGAPIGGAVDRKTRSTTWKIKRGVPIASLCEKETK
jgi:hypothetical protein